MQFKKIVSIISLISVGSLSFTTLSFSHRSNEKKAVTQDDVVNENDYYQYIYDRSFSIAYGNFASYVFEGVLGTGWLFNHITNADDPYTYYMLTCWHVKFGMELCEKHVDGWDYYVGKTIGQVDNAAIGWDQYFYPKSFSWVTEGEYQNVNGIHWGVDCAVAKVSFGASPKERFKVVLDKLNDFGNKHNNYLEDFATNNSTKGNHLYVAGYPGQDITNGDLPSKAGAGVWERGNDAIDNIWRYFTKGKPNSLNINHVISEENQFDNSQNIYSMGDVYLFPNENSLTDNVFHPLYDLGPGASGSMVLNDKFEVVGIYWGSYIDDYNPDDDDWMKKTGIYPAVDMFITDQYNLYDYLSELIGLTNQNSIIVYVLIPIFSCGIVGAIIAVVLFNKKKGNEQLKKK